ncbi:hypothetical protein C2G38_2219449 [Gigaspora rosea]|uniref:Uncharacterized protein n=1 Tax=Gigaspora rosea TaxID=44941 RepID=A0A397U5H5_9GLOM|nr:hypothetical protein C2G38_2219449 [Gigaspora rosea]
MTTIIYNKQRKELATLVLEPNNFKKMLKESVILYLIAGLRNMHANQFKLELA